MTDNSEITIRTRLLPGDIGYIAYLHGKLYASEFGYGLNFETFVLQGLAEFSSQYNPAKDKVWICEHHQKTIGFMVAFHRGNSIQLRYFLLLPEYRGFGLGKKLMLEFLTYMEEQKMKSAFLLTTHEQQAAISLYTRHGFYLSEEKESAVFGKTLKERRYELKISS